MAFSDDDVAAAKEAKEAADREEAAREKAEADMLKKQAKESLGAAGKSGKAKSGWPARGLQ